MSKTPEELAEEYAEAYIESDSYLCSKHSFLAGYKAAQDQLADADKVIIPKENCRAVLKAMQSEQELSEQAIRWTKTLPPASERCNQCACQGYKAGYQAAAPQWISVEDKLPEEDVAVLVYGQILNDPPDVIGVRRRYNGDQEWKHTWESEDGFIYREDDVTHWMPLPEPPKEEK